MKKIILIGLLLIGCRFVWAATQYQRLGTVQLSTTTLTGGLSLWSVTAAQELALTATTTGQLIWCSNCVSGNKTLGAVCVSTGSTLANQFIYVSSFTALTACQ